MRVATDCLHYRGDRPCRPHKERGVHCDGCDSYVPQGRRILMIKLDAIGDVLRTTCLLPPLARRYPDSHLTWITDPASVSLFRSNPYVHRVLPYGPEALAALAVTGFDIAMNLDASPRSCTLMSLARARERVGFYLTEKGEVRPCDERGEHWWRMGVFDDIKKANSRSYQELMCEIAGLDPAGCRYVLALEEEEVARARAFLEGLELGPGSGSGPIVGLNTGAGGRWEYKRWTMAGYQALVDRLQSETGARILLLGGPDEAAFNQELARRARRAVLLSGSHSLRDFAALVSLTDVVVTGDTLGLHVALATGRRTVVLFGPTSQAEIELFGQGLKLAPEMDCLVCYLERCPKKPACMDLITPDRVFEAVREELGRDGKLL